MKKIKRRSAGIKGTCPKTSAFIRAFEGRLSLEEKERLIDHVLGCAKCRVKFDTLQSLSRELETREDDIPEDALSRQEMRGLRAIAGHRIKELELEGRPAVRKAKLFRLIPFPILATAAALLIVVIGGMIFFVKRGPENVYREVDKKTLVLYSPEGCVVETPSLFTWSPLIGTDYYYFRLVDENLNTLYRGGSSIPRLVLPQEIRAMLAKGKTYVWKIEALDDRHYIIGTGVRSFTIR